MTLFRSTIGVVLAMCVSASLWAQTLDVQNAWARATVQGQQASGAFMTLTSKTGGKLVGVRTPVAGVAEVHEMSMEGNVMKMRALPNGLDLPAGKPVELTPGGFHIMLMDLKLRLQKDTTIPLTLVFQDAKGLESTTDVKVPVSFTAPSGAANAGAAADHSGHQH